MSFDPLPRAYLTWDESEEALDSFLRYQVYRRVSGEEEWSKRARINDRSITFWEDVLAHSGVDYEYAVTQVIDVSGEEIESAFPSAVGGSLTINDVFIHDVRAPEHYVQLYIPQLQLEWNQGVGFVQPWSRSSPTAHVGQVLTRTLQLVLGGSWEFSDPADGPEQWRALENLLRRQRDYGSALMVRNYRDIAVIGVLAGLSRSDSPITMQERMTFRETYYREEVD